MESFTLKKLSATQHLDLYDRSSILRKRHEEFLASSLTTMTPPSGSTRQARRGDTAKVSNDSDVREWQSGGAAALQTPEQLQPTPIVLGIGTPYASDPTTNYGETVSLVQDVRHRRVSNQVAVRSLEQFIEKSQGVRHALEHGLDELRVNDGLPPGLTILLETSRQRKERDRRKKHHRRKQQDGQHTHADGLGDAAVTTEPGSSLSSGTVPQRVPQHQPEPEPEPPAPPLGWREYQQAAIRVQRHVRGHQARQQYQQQYRAAQCAASVIQARWREHEAWRRQDQAALRVQQQYRGHLARVQVQALKEQRHVAAQTIQHTWMAQAPKREYKRVTQNAAAVTVQRHWRGHTSRQQFQRQHAQEMSAAQRIQQEWRRYERWQLDQAEAQMQADREAEAALCIQQQWRDYCVRQQHQQQLLQAQAESRRAEEEEEEETRAVQEQAAQTIQHQWRMHATQQHNQDEHSVEELGEENEVEDADTVPSEMGSDDMGSTLHPLSDSRLQQAALSIQRTWRRTHEHLGSDDADADAPSDDVEALVGLNLQAEHLDGSKRDSSPHAAIISVPAPRPDAHSPLSHGSSPSDHTAPSSTDSRHQHQHPTQSLSPPDAFYARNVEDVDVLPAVPDPHRLDGRLAQARDPFLRHIPGHSDVDQHQHQHQALWDYTGLAHAEHDESSTDRPITERCQHLCLKTGFVPRTVGRLRAKHSSQVAWEAHMAQQKLLMR